MGKNLLNPVKFSGLKVMNNYDIIRCNNSKLASSLN